MHQACILIYISLTHKSLQDIYVCGYVPWCLMLCQAELRSDPFVFSSLYSEEGLGGRLTVIHALWWKVKCLQTNLSHQYIYLFTLQIYIKKKKTLFNMWIIFFCQQSTSIIMLGKLYIKITLSCGNVMLIYCFRYTYVNCLHLVNGCFL